MSTGQLKIGALFHYLGFFRRLAGLHVVVYAIVVLLGSWAEGFGIALLLPLLAASSPANDDRLSRIVEGVLQAVGLSPSVESVLLALVVVAIVRACFTFLSVAYQSWLTHKITQDLRRRLVNDVQRLDYRYVLGTNTATLINLVYTLTAQTASAFHTLSAILPRLVTITLFAAILTVLDWRLTLIVGTCGFAAGLFLRWPTLRAQRISAEITAEGTALSVILWQSLAGFKYLTTTNAVPKLHKKIFALVRSITTKSYRSGFLGAISHSLPQPLVALLLAGIMLYQIQIGGSGVSAGIVLLIYLYRMMNEILGLQIQWQAFAQVTGPVDALIKGMSEIESNAATNGAIPCERFEESIELRDVGFTYDGGKAVLERINIRIPRNKTIAFVGESGSGKTTLMDLVTGLLRPTSGQVLVDGRDLRELDVNTWRNRIGFVPQETTVFEDSIANNICLWECDPGQPECMERIRAAAMSAHCHDFISNTSKGYDTNAGDRGVKLSGGQRQRIAIAREIFKNPEILILDEATSALDSESEGYIQRSIDELKGRLTILVIAHRLSTIKRCDFLYVLERGTIVEEGTFPELLARDGSRFQQMAKLQNLGA